MNKTKSINTPWRMSSFIVILLAALIGSSCNSADDFSNREQNFDEEWKFYLGDLQGAESMDFDDSQWRMLDLPHDWSIEDLPANPDKKQVGPFTEDSEGKGSTGHVKGGTGWYRKTFTLDESSTDKKVQICFDGVYRECDVWLNGQHLGFHAYGYTPFTFNLTPHLKPAGQQNVLTVKVSNPGKNSRWYSGSGIYRPVTLQVTGLVNIPVWGTFITTPEVSAEKASVKVQTAVNNSTADEVEVTVVTRLLAPDGTEAGKTESTLAISSAENDTLTQVIEVNAPARWSIDTPNLYQAVSEIRYNGQTADQKTTAFGIRSIEFSAEKGFLLNGERVLIKGGCMHHDNGPLGAAAIGRAEERRVELMKQFGFNAIRTAHNPPSAQFLEACDRLGILVIDEAFDHWQKPKNPQDYSIYFDKYHKEDLEAMILRDRNHPSIIIWSIGNEIKERADSSGLAITKRLGDIIKKLDTSRPVNAAICDFWDNKGKTWKATIPAFALLDIGGYNYQYKHYESDHEQFPNRMILGTESTAREAFESWQMVEKHPYVLGDFVWTSMDYLGESGIGRSEITDANAKDLSAPDWPWYNGYCGDIDICGFKKPQSYYRDVLWKISNFEMAVHSPIPAGKKEIISYWGWPDEHQSWNWKGHEGNLQVNVYSSYPEVRLELNGKVIGTKAVSADTKLTATFEVPYEAGELKAVALKDGKDVESKVIKTTGTPARIRLTADRPSIGASRNDLAYVTVEVLDEAGNLVPDAQMPIQFKVEGEGTLAAVENGNPTDVKSFSTPKVTSFKGRCLVILRPSGKAGAINLKAEGEGLTGADLAVKLN